jgi:hypothetical protein
MKASAYTLANLPSPLRQRLAELLGHTWFRGRTRHSRSVIRKHGATSTDVDGVFRALSITHIGQLSVFTTDIGWSRAWYEDVTGLHHSRTMELEPHPLKPDRQIRCCYLSAQCHDECLVLIEEYDPAGRIVAPSGMSFLHFALEPEGKEASPVDDDQTGRDVARGLYDPDWNYVEFCQVMDAESNHRERCHDIEDHQRQSLDSRRRCQRPRYRSRQAAIEARADAAAK